MKFTVYFFVKALVLLISLSMSFYYDIREHKIKNFITIPAALIGCLINFMEKGLSGLSFSVEGWLTPVIFLILFYYINVMGAGDIKLFAAIGAIMGLPFVIFSFTFTVCLGSIIGLALMIKRRALLFRMRILLNYFLFSVATRKLSPYVSKNDLSSKFAFSVAIIPGTCLQLLLTILELKSVI